MSNLPTFARELELTVTSVARKSTTPAVKANDPGKLVKKTTATTKDKPTNFALRSSSSTSTNGSSSSSDNPPEMDFRRKTRKKIPVGALYDENGALINPPINLCDCLQESCPGCYFPCPKCQSQKCGVECRIYRKFAYDEIEYHGYNYVVTNKYK